MQATSNRVGFEWLVSPALLFQNYHLIHHLYPHIPFYRYAKVWRDSQSEFEAQGALLHDWYGDQIPTGTDSRSK